MGLNRGNGGLLQNLTSKGGFGRGEFITEGKLDRAFTVNINL